MVDKKKPEYIRVRLNLTTIEKLREISKNKNIGKIGCKTTFDELIDILISIYHLH